METRYCEISGTEHQRAIFQQRLGRDVDTIAAAVISIMGMADMPVRFRISLRGDHIDVQAEANSLGVLQEIRHNPVAFCSKSQGKIYISAPDATIRIVAHEMAHHVLNTYFSDPIPTALHELIAQTVEERVCKKLSRWIF